MLPLPLPERGGSIETLQSFLNLASRNDFVLIVAWLLAALRSGGPYPLLAISGEQGSAKTVLSKLLKALIDPNAAPVRALSREERELMIAANNGYVLAFDNLSGLPNWLSDALCRLATGGSFAVRQLYTDDEEMLFEAARPILLNGIEEVVSRPDLGDRAIFLTLAPDCRDERRSEANFGASSGSRGPAFSAPCSTRWCMGCGHRRCPPRSAAAHGRLRALDHGLRTSPMACRHLRPRLRGKPQSGDREHHRSRSHSHLRAYNHGRSGHVDRERVRPTAFVRARVLAMTSRRAPHGQKTRGRSLVDCDGRRRSSGRLGIEITFSREGQSGARMIRVSTKGENTVSNVSIVSAGSSNGSGADQFMVAGSDH